MSNELAVDVERLRDAARFTKDKAQTIRDELTRLDNTIGKELLVDGWQGKAASAYDESWLEWKAGAETVIAALEQSATSLADAAIQYELQDNATRDAITKVAVLDLS